jgi:multidrug resistance efflux pump
VRAAEVKLVNARTEFGRYQTVARANPRAVAAMDMDRAETAYRVAQEEFKAAQQMLEKGTIAREEDLEA